MCLIFIFHVSALRKFKSILQLVLLHSSTTVTGEDSESSSRGAVGPTRYTTLRCFLNVISVFYCNYEKQDIDL